MLESFLHNNSKALLDVVVRWSVVTPHLFNQKTLLERLQCKNIDTSVNKNYNNSRNYHGINSAQNNNNGNNTQNNAGNNNNGNNTVNSGNNTGNNGNNNNNKDNLSYKVQSWHLTECQAQLHIISGNHEKALSCYLSMKTLVDENDGEEKENNNENNDSNDHSNNDSSRDNSNNYNGNYNLNDTLNNNHYQQNNNNNNNNSNNTNSSSGSGSAVGKNDVAGHPYSHIFNLIEREVRVISIFYLFIYFCLMYIFICHFSFVIFHLLLLTYHNFPTCNFSMIVIVEYVRDRT